MPVGADEYAPTVIMLSWKALHWAAPAVSGVVVWPAPEITAIAYAATIANAEQTKHRNAIRKAAAPRFSLGQINPNVNRALNEYSESPRRGTQRYGDKPSTRGEQK
jgi:hypothetical protein